MFDEQDRKWLYEQMQQAGVNTGTYEDFKKSLNDDTDRAWYYDKSIELGLNVGNSDEFTQMMTEPLTQPTAQQPAQRRTRYDVAQERYQQGVEQTNAMPLSQTAMGSVGGYGISPTGMPVRNTQGYPYPTPQPQAPAKPMAPAPRAGQWSGAPMQQTPYAPTEEEGNMSFMPIEQGEDTRQAYAERKQAKRDLWQQQNDEIEGMVADEQDKLNSTERVFNPVTRMYTDKEGKPLKTTSDRLQDLQAAQRAMRNSKRIIDAADAKSGFWQGMKDHAFDLDKWDFGITDIKDLNALKRAVEAYDKGEELTDSQQALLDAKALEMAVNVYFSSELSRGYTAGQDIGTSLPYMAAFMTGIGSAVGKGTTKSLIKYFTKRFAKTMESKAGRTALKGVSRVTGDFARAADMTTTIGGVRTATGAQQRMMGQTKFDEDEQGNVRYAGHTEGENALRAVGKEALSRTLTNFSEMFGEYLPFLGKGGRWLARTKGGKAVGLDKMVGFFDNVASSEIGSFIGRIESKAEFHGAAAEMAEEMFDGVTQATFVGDQTLQDVFGKENLTRTALSVGIMSMFFSGAKLGGYGVAKGFNAADMAVRTRRADRAAANAFGTQWDGVKGQLDGATAEQAADIIQGMYESREYTGEQLQSVLNYAIYKKGNEMIERYKANNQTPQEAAAEQSYNAGYEDANTEELRRDIEKAYTDARQSLVELIGEENVAVIDEDPIAMQRLYDNDPNVSDDVTWAVASYVSAKSAWDGVQQRIADDAEDNAAAKREAYKPMMRKDGTVHPVTLNVEGADGQPKTVYLLDGSDVAVNPDGSIDREKSSETLTAYDPELGKNVFLDDPYGDRGIQSVGDVLTAEAYEAQIEAERQAEIQERMGRGNREDRGDGGQVVRTPGAPEAYTQGMVMGVVDKAGQEHEAEVVGRVRYDRGKFVPAENGMFVEYTVDGQTMHEAPGKLNEMVRWHETAAQPQQPQQPITATEGQTPTAGQTAPQEGNNATTEQPQVEYPRDKQGNIDYDKIGDATTFATALGEEFGEDAPATLDEIIAEETAKMEKQNAVGKARIRKRLAMLEEAKAQLTPTEEAPAEAPTAQTEATTTEPMSQAQPSAEESGTEGNKPSKKALSQLEIAKRELADDAGALEILNDLAPRTLDEVAAILLTSGKNQVKLQMSDEQVDGVIRKGFMSMTGYSREVAKRYLSVFASHAKGGVSFARFGEMVEEAAREQGVQFDENDPMAGVNAALEMFGNVGRTSDINNYIADRRTAQAYDYHNAALAQADAYMREQLGVNQAEYDAWVQMMEQDAAAIDEQKYNEIFQDNERTAETDNGGTTTEGASTLQGNTAESVEIPTPQTDTRGVGEDAGGEQAEVSKYEEAEKAFFGFMEWANWEYDTNYDWNSLMSFLKWANKKAKAKKQPLRKFVREWIGDKYPPKDAAELTDKIFAALKEREEEKKAETAQQPKEEAEGGTGTAPQPVGGATAQGETPAAEQTEGTAEGEKQEQPKQETPKQEPKADKEETNEPKEPKRLISDEQMHELKERLRNKLRGQLNSGIDPETLSIGLQLAVGHIERGLTKFADFAKRMVEDLGDAIRPYLKSFYNGARDFPGAEKLAEQMTPYDEVSKFDVLNFDKEGPKDIIATAEQIANEQEVAKQVEKLKKSPKKAKSEEKDVSLQSETPPDLFSGIEEDGEERKAGQLSGEERKRLSGAVTRELIVGLATGEKPFKSIVDIRNMAKRYGIEVDSEGRDDIELQEIVEDGLVRAARSIADNSTAQREGAKETFDKICRLYEMQPTISRRSGNKVKMQQYSTPLPMGFVADLFAWREGKRVLEPTAGNGMLVFALPSKNVVANELDETRLANLREQGFEAVMNEDATGEGVFAPKEYDSVIANPPFGKAEAKEYDGNSIAGLEEQITLNALSAMKDDGRAAIIVGGNMKYGKNGAVENNRAFWTYLYDHYNVKGVVDMDGKLYARQGTTYPTRMILIDGRRSEEERAQSIVYPPRASEAVRKAETFEDLYEIVNEINKSNKKTNGNEVLRTGSMPVVPDADNAGGRPVKSNTDREHHADADNGQHGGTRPADSGRGGRGDGKHEPSGDSGTAQAGTGGVRQPGDAGVHGAEGNHGERPDVRGESGGGERGGDTGRVHDEGVRGAGTAVGGVRLKIDTGKGPETQKRTLTEEKLPYRPHNSAFSLESVAPAAMVEAMDKSLAEIESKWGDIDEFVTRELGYDSIEAMHNALAAEQVDSVAMAIYQMQQGKGMIIGDQTGVGKGRQMAALIRWAHNKGKKPIFITQKADLFSDIYRDLVDIGSGDLRPFIFNSDGAIVDSNGEVVHKPLSSEKQAKVFASGKLPDEYDFAVLTYSQVNTGDEISNESAKGYAKESGRRSKKSKAAKNKKDTPKAKFLREIAQANYLLLDESHTAAGDSNVGAYIRSIIGTYAGSQIGYAQGVGTGGVLGVTFASATFAKRPDTMPMYAMRTAMSEANVEPSDLIKIIEKGGVTLQEIMSRALTESGQMVRRERDMSDVKTDWITIEDPATVKRARENYDKTIGAFNAIIQFQERYVMPMIEQLDKQMSLMAGSAGVKKGTKKMGVENVPFASKTYNYTKQLMLALKVDAIVDKVAEEIKAARHPVIALESTMEASIKDYAAGEVIAEPTFSASLLRGLDTVMQYTVKDGKGKETHYRYDPKDLGSEGEQAYYALQDYIREATNDIFISPLDAMIEKLKERGYKIGELTGRNNYVERDGEGRVVVKRRTDKDKKRMQRDFNSGALDVLILNKSASTGISLHASEKFSDQRQRSMIIAQPLSDINDYMQMIGRIDRTGQVHRGYYINLGLPVPAESRFLMMLSTKLKSLNANTTTSQENEDNSVDAPDLLNKYGSQIVVEYLRDNPDIYVKMGEPLKKSSNVVHAEDLDEFVAPKDDEVARKITGYVALLNTQEQEDFYTEVVRRYNDLIKYLDSTGTNDLKITVMPLKAKTLSRKVSSEGKDPNGNNPFAQNAYVEEVEMDVLRKPMKADEVKALTEKLNRLRDGSDGRGMSNRTNSINKRVDEILKTVESEEAEKLAAEEERYATAKARAAEDIAQRRETIAKQNRSEEEKAEALEKYTSETNEKVERRHEANVSKIKSTKFFMTNGLTEFKVGDTYFLPQSMGDSNATQEMFKTPAILCGYKVKESKLTPSTSFMVFAPLDGRRRVEVKFTDNNSINSIKFLKETNWNEAKQTTLENWDSQIPNNTRKTGFIMTGNILQAVSDTQDKNTGSYPGQLVSYTDAEGNIHDGILMPDRWEPSLLNTAGAPINARMEQILKGDYTVSTDGKVEILGSGYGKSYTLNVPRSKKEGAKYYENPVILSCIRRDFWQSGNRFSADIDGEENMRRVVEELARLDVRVQVEEKEGGRIYREEPVFYSNAMRAVENIKQERATPEQWLKMIEKQGGLKAGEDKWLGLSEWLKGMSDRKDRNDRVLTLTKGEVLDYIRANEIQVEEVEYGEDEDISNSPKLQELNDEHSNLYFKCEEETGSHDPQVWARWAYEQMANKYGDDFRAAIRLVGRGEDSYIDLRYDSTDRISDEAYNYLSVKPINEIRLQYTTEGLDNKREIVLTVPTIEPWNEHDEVHFGEAGGGRAVAWVRFGETTIPNEEWEKKKIAEIRESDAALEDFEKRMEEKYGTSRYQLSFRRSLSDEEKKTYSDLLNKGKQLNEEYRNRPDLRVLVIDEIQSNRHQEGREKGYKSAELQKKIARMEELNSKMYTSEGLPNEEYEELLQLRGEGIGQQSREKSQAVPDAPFDKNWHEVAMKRMLRFAAENGYDKVAWTKGEQQAERYDLGGLIAHIDIYPYVDDFTGKRVAGEYEVFPVDTSGDMLMNRNEYPFSGHLTADEVLQYYGKDLGTRMMQAADNAGDDEKSTIEGEGLRIGGEGMKGFYDQILPRFMDKYGKKWGVKTGEVELPNLGDRNDRENRGDRGLTMWSVDVTDDMRESVMRGQPLFREGEGSQVEYVSYEESLRRSKEAGYTKRQHDARVRQYWPQRKASVERQAQVLNLGDHVIVAVNAEELEAMGMRLTERDRRSKGWYDRDTGKIVIILQNNTSMDDVSKTLLHEGVGHYGLRYLFGEHFDEFLDLVYAAGDVNIRREIAQLSTKYGYDVRSATEEYLSRMAEDEDFERPEHQDWWRRVKMAFFTMLRRIGFDIKNWKETITDNELRYILWRSYQNLKEQGAYRNLVEVAEDVAMQAKLKVGAFEEEDRNDRGDRINSRADREDDWRRAVAEAKRHWPDAMVMQKEGDYYIVSGEDAQKAAKILVLPLVQKTDGSDMVGFPSYAVDNYLSKLVRAGQRVAIVDSVKEDAVVYGEDGGAGRIHRDGDFSERDEVTARDYYERMVSSSGYQVREAMQDSMLGLRNAYEAILGGGKKFRIEEVPGNENAYLAENRMSSVNAAEQHNYFVECMKPLLEEIHKICGSKKALRQELTDYMMAKHGLERNEKFAQRDFDAYQQQNPTGGKTLGDFRERDYAGLTALTGMADVHDAELAAMQMVADFEARHDVSKLWAKTKKATGVTLAKIYLSGMLSEESYEQIRDQFEFYIPLQGFDETTSDEVYGYLTSRKGPFGSPIKHAEGRSSKADDPIATIGLMADMAIRQANRNEMKKLFLNFVLDHPSDLVSVNRLWLQYDDVNDEWVPVFADIEEGDTAADVERKVAAFEERMEKLAAAEPKKYKHGRNAKNIPYRVLPGNLSEHQVLVKRDGETYVLTINGNPRAAQALNGLTNPDVKTGGFIGGFMKASSTVNRFLSSAYTTRTPDFVVSNFFRDMLYSNCMTWVKEGRNYALRFHKNFGKFNPATMRVLFGKWEKGTLDDSTPIEFMFKQFMLNGGETGYTNVRDIEAHKREIARELKRQGNVPRKVWHAFGMQLDLVNRSVENCARFAAFITSQELGRSIERSIYDAKEVSVNFNKKGSGDKMMGAEGQTKIGNVAAFLSGAGRCLQVFWNAGVQGMTNFGRAAKHHPGKFSAGAATMFALGAIVPLLAKAIGDDDDDENAYYNLPEYVRRSNICFRLTKEMPWITIPLPIEFRAIYGLGELGTGVITGDEHYSDSELARQLIAQVSQILPMDFMEGQGGLHNLWPSLAKPIVEASNNKGWTGLPIYRDNPFNQNDPEFTKVYKNADKNLVAASKWLNELTGGDDYKKGWADVVNPAQVEYVLNGYLGGWFKVPNQLMKMGETAFGDREFEWRNMMLANRLIKNGDERTANRKLQNEYFELKDEYEETKRLLKKYKNAADEGVLKYAEKLAFLNESEEYGRYLIFDDYRMKIDKLFNQMKGEEGEQRKATEEEYYSVMREMVDKVHEYDKGR